MEILWALGVTLFWALVGAAVGHRLRLPVANMMGAMFAVAIFNVVTGKAEMPANVRIFTQIINGTFIGAGIFMADLYVLRKMVPAAILNIVGMLAFGVVTGWLLCKMTPYDLVTMLFACAPGGMTDMPLIGHDYGADVAVVAVLQLVRVLSCVSVLPFVLRWLLHKMKYDRVDLEEKITKVEPKPGSNGKNFALTLAVGVAGGLIGVLTGVPAGALIFAMIACGAFNIVTNRGFMPKRVRALAQLLAGALVGSGITWESLVQMRMLIVPAVLLGLSCIVLDFVLAFVFVRFFGVDVPTALFANAAGGSTDMAIMSLEFHANGAAVALLQTFRMCGTILCYPVIVRLLM